MLTYLRPVKNLLVPKGRRLYRLPFGPAAGCRMRLDLQNQFIQYLGVYERELTPHFRRLLEPGLDCFDIGGQGGYDALLMAKLTGGKILSCECDPVWAEELRQTFLCNRYEIDVFQGFVSDNNEGGHITLDQLAKMTFAPNFIKIDIEGGEASALRGAGRIIERAKPAMIIEIHGAEQELECRNILQEYGYSIQTVYPRRFAKERRPLEHNFWFVCEA